MATHDEMVAVFEAAIDGSDPDAFVARARAGRDRVAQPRPQGSRRPREHGRHRHARQLVDGLTNESLLFAPIDGGFVLQFVARGTVRSNGNPFEMHNCLIVTTTDGLITRLDEYVDPTVGAQFA